MSKFNLKDHKKINLDQHTEMRLKEQHSETPDVINEAQLEKGRVPEKEVTIEALLEKNRTGSATEVTERRLDTADAKFENKYRNAETAKGNINKLEEQRLKNDPVENEKYEPASEAGKQLRWWETSKSPDGLKVAQKKIEKIAYQEEDDLAGDVIAPEEAAISPLNEFPISDPDFDIIDKTEDIDETKSMMIDPERSKFLNGKIPGVYILLRYDTADFEGDEDAIINAAMFRVLEQYPELNGLIDVADFTVKEDMGDIGEVILRGVGDEFKDLKHIENVGVSRDISFDETSYNEKSIRGTPMAIGQLYVSVPVDKSNKQKIIEEAMDYLSNLHPNLHINPKSFDFSQAAAKRIGYTAPVEAEIVDKRKAERERIQLEKAISKQSPDNFPVQEVTASSVKQVKEADSVKKKSEPR